MPTPCGPCESDPELNRWTTRLYDSRGGVPGRAGTPWPPPT
ncbi:hypothetical protein QJS66_10770 [Kocuria rhizophila]|nr:hypothetical protein QJS66_10770 [Kocuria rhizophila]